MKPTVGWKTHVEQIWIKGDKEEIQGSCLETLSTVRVSGSLPHLPLHYSVGKKMVQQRCSHPNP